jgi:Fur family transcriptional regulator, ferric uptake regulator
MSSLSVSGNRLSNITENLIENGFQNIKHETDSKSAHLRKINKDKYISYIKERLKLGGCRTTTQRLQIIDVIYENNKHMNIEEIYSKLISEKVGISTIYRNFIKLEEVGVLKRIDVANTSYYELEEIGENKFHIHIKCDKCNKIIDINEEEISQNFAELTAGLKKKHKITVKSTSVVLSGVCMECETNIKVEGV